MSSNFWYNEPSDVLFRLSLTRTDGMFLIVLIFLSSPLPLDKSGNHTRSLEMRIEWSREANVRERYSGRTCDSDYDPEMRTALG